MKNIGIITLHSPMNCGSALQAHALNYYLNNLENYSSFIIDYQPRYIENEGNAFRNFIRKNVFPFSYHIRKKRFSLFVKQFDVLSEKTYRSYDELVDNSPKADIYVTGSDQLWNPCFSCGNDDSFFLKFVSNVPKMSYATSLGTADYNNKQLMNIANNISDFAFVSVRELCSLEQLKSVGINNPVCVCDPTLLLPSSYYRSIAKKLDVKKPFVAVYLVEKSPLLDHILCYFKNKGFLIVGVGGYLKKYKCDKHLKDAGPLEFLGLLSSASFVVASSFHACVFSQIFHKEFVIIPPKINPERITELLKITGLTDRIIASTDDFDRIDSLIDYELVQEKLDSFVSVSKSIFESELNKIK